MKELGKNMVEEAGKKGVGKAIDLLFDKYVNPKIEMIANSPQDILDLEEQFKTYLSKRYDINKYINTIVFHNENKTIDELYIPLTIVQNGKQNNISFSKGMNNIFDTPIKYLIMDTAGTGKSTLVKFLSTHCIEKSWGYPFVVELRRLEKDQLIEEYILNDVQLICKKVKRVDIKDLIRRGDFIFFLDGYDEIVEDKKENVTKTIREFVTSSDRNCFIMTSRDDDLLSEFSDFKKFHIQELTKEEAYELIRKYDNYGEVSKSLIDEIEKDENYNVIKEFLGNPLMVSLLYMSYEYNRVLHHKKSIFYRQVYDALYFRHDSIKGDANIHEKKSKLDSESFRKVLCAMGFLSVKQGKVEFTKDEIIQLIRDSVNIFPDINTKGNCFLNDILHAVPLFKEEGLNYKWVHKSFSEYFAAVFICQEYKEYEKVIFTQILNAKNNQRYYNVLDFCYDLDYKCVMENLVYPVLNEFVNFYESEIINKKVCLFAEAEVFYKFLEKNYIIKDKKIFNANRDFKVNYIAIMKFLNANNIEQFSFISFLSYNRKTMMVVVRNSKFEIIKLLFRKNVDIFKKIGMRKYKMDFLDFLEDGKYDIFSKDCDLLKNNYIPILDNIIQDNNEFQRNILDIKKCNSLIKTIEQEKDKIPSGFFDLC